MVKKMKTLVLFTAALVCFSSFADPGDAVTNERNPKLRRECVSKRFPELEGSMKIHVTKTGSQRASVMKREVADVCCVLRFGNCATKCFNIDRHL